MGPYFKYRTFRFISATPGTYSPPPTSTHCLTDSLLRGGTTPYMFQQTGRPCIAIDQPEEASELTAKRLSTPLIFF